MTLLQASVDQSELILTLRQTLGEKCIECEHLIKKADSDSQTMKVRKQELLKETKELKDARDDLRRANNDLESRLEQANERTEDVKRRERELND